jgi:hypothetical protein
MQRNVHSLILSLLSVPYWRTRTRIQSPKIFFGWRAYLVCAMHEQHREQLDAATSHFNVVAIELVEKHGYVLAGVCDANQ